MDSNTLIYVKTIEDAMGRLPNGKVFPDDKINRWKKMKWKQIVKELVTKDTIQAVAQWDSYVIYSAFIPNIRKPDMPMPDFIKLKIILGLYKNEAQTIVERMAKGMIEKNKAKIEKYVKDMEDYKNEQDKE